MTRAERASHAERRYPICRLCTKPVYPEQDAHWDRELGLGHEDCFESQWDDGLDEQYVRELYG